MEQSKRLILSMMLKMYLSFLLGLFLLISSISFNSSTRDLSQDHQTHSINIVWNNFAPYELNLKTVKIIQQLQLNWNAFTTFQLNNFVQLLHHRVYQVKIKYHLFKQSLNDKVPISIRVQCFRN